MKTYRPDLSQRHRFEQLSYRLRTWLLALSGLVILVSLILAVVVFSYIFNLATQPEEARILVDQWSQVFTANSGSPLFNLPTLAGPARWFAVFTLGVLAYLLTRIPLLMLQMGTHLLSACTYERRSMQEVLREVLTEAKRDSLMDGRPPQEVRSRQFPTRSSRDHER